MRNYFRRAEFGELLSSLKYFLMKWQKQLKFYGDFYDLGWFSGKPRNKLKIFHALENVQLPGSKELKSLESFSQMRKIKAEDFLKNQFASFVVLLTSEVWKGIQIFYWNALQAEIDPSEVWINENCSGCSGCCLFRYSLWRKGFPV